MAEYSRLARGSFTSTGALQTIYLPFQPTQIELWNQSVWGTATASTIPQAWWDVSQAQGTALVTYYNSSPALIDSVVNSNGISTFNAATIFNFGARQQIIGATAANPIVFNVTAHGYNVGDTVMFEGLYQSPTTGMPQIAGMPFVISAVADANHFSVVWPGGGSNYTALSGSPAGAFVKKINNPYLYAPGVAFIEAITLGATTTVATTAPHNFVQGQQVGFHIPTVWGTTQLNEYPNNLVPGKTNYFYVTSVTNSTTFVCSAVTTSGTAFNTHQTVASVPGLTFPQVVAVGDVNSGGTAYSGGALYPSPVINGVSTINGPSISGAFVNNTRMGFTVGVGNAVVSGTPDTSSFLVGASGNVFNWVARYFDIG